MPKRFDQGDRDRLNQQYDARLVAPRFRKDEVYRRESQRVLCEIQRISDLVYDPQSGSKLDIYPAKRGAPTFVWIHGGYWRSSSKDDNAFVAPAFVAAGVNVVSIGYSLAPNVTLDEIVRQVRSAVAWLKANGDRYGLDVRRIHLGGHSAGGHLVGMLLMDGWRASHGLEEDVFGVALCVSGLFDLHPLVYTFVNDVLRLDEEAAQRNSPLLHLPSASSARLITTCGGMESAEFKRQSSEYLSAWRAREFDGLELDMPGLHHFDIILELERRDSRLFAETYSSILQLN